MNHRFAAALAGSLLALGCDQTVVLKRATTGGRSGGSTTAGTPSSNGATSSSGTTQGLGVSTSSGASSTTTGTTGTGGTTGTTTGTGTSTGSSNPFEDGGYVVCNLATAADAGPDGDGGPASWMCIPGTYFCDLSGNLGNCFQCRTDADCADQALPTYDPSRLRCDLGSGVPGYQGFCQQCLAQVDCTGNAAGSFCDLNPTFPAAIEPSIEDLGFETCGRLVTDCRLDGGPACRGQNQFCDQSDGHCATRTSACTTDADCVGFLITPNMPQPYCVAGACSPCPNVFCPAPYYVECTSDAQCGNPDGGSAGEICNLQEPFGDCVCTDSSQCNGIWPACEGLDAGAPGGSCGCDDDQECGDAGLVCLMAGQPLSFCGISCLSPKFIGCTNPNPVCEPDSGFCQICFTDQQCQANPLSGGLACDDVSYEGPGSCGCVADGDCPAGETCQAGSYIGSCAPTSRCTPDSCEGYFCDWDSGICQNTLTSNESPACITDYDCSTSSGAKGPFCDPKAGCVECRSNADCVELSQDQFFRDYSLNYCCLPGSPTATGCGTSYNRCWVFCTDDADCSSIPGTICDTDSLSLGYSRCETPCTMDAGCADSYGGTRCQILAGESFGEVCGCLVDSDCKFGTLCPSDGGSFSSCESERCSADSDCPEGWSCAVGNQCLPRCDDGGSCQAPDLICDTENLLSNNGIGGGPYFDGQHAEPGAIWCYGCLQRSDCDAGLICSDGECSHCTQDSDCAPGRCLDGTCLTPCDAGQCPGGQVCDTEGVAGHGVDQCYQCLGAVDCPDGQGCNSQSHTCGTCAGPNVRGGPFDCPPDAICSNYWGGTSGVCLPSCDVRSCPAAQPLCAVLPALTPDHKFCFGCLQDSDCADAGAWCDVSVDLTFTCRLLPGQ